MRTRPFQVTAFSIKFPRSHAHSYPHSLYHYSCRKIHRRSYHILALESSADDTCAAVLRAPALEKLTSPPTIKDGVKLLSNVVKRQPDLLEMEGGINPLLSLWRHQSVMPEAIQEALNEAKISLVDVDAIAFTRGPGMGSGLSICSLASRTLVASLNATPSPLVPKTVKLVGVHHMQAHALTVFLTDPNPPPFPFLTILISGGHTLLVLCNSTSSFRILSSTGDEALGNSVDMISRSLGIPWKDKAPGAALEDFAKPANEEGFLDSVPPELERIVGEFPVPMRRREEMSFAGLRSHTMRVIEALKMSRSLSPMGEEEGIEIENVHEGIRRLVAHRFQEAAFTEVCEKTVWFVKKLKEEEGIKLNGIVVSGGVASNLRLRQRLRVNLDKKKFQNLPLHFPPPTYCTDNAAMIAYVGLDKLIRGKEDATDVQHRPKWSIERCEDQVIEEEDQGPKPRGRKR